jgi:ankyrin repeat protein
MAGFLYNPSPEPVAAVKALLDAGARVDEVDVWGGTALRSALGSNNVDVAQVLLDAGADVNNYIDGPMGDSHGNTLLAEAVFWYSLTNDPTMIALLLERGADVNYRSPSPFRGMCGAAGYPECTFEGQTALTRAAANGLYDVVRLLLDHGADPNLSRRDGETAAALARAYRHPDVAVMIDRYAAGVSRAR